jgi:hypothetical protein
MIRRYVPLLLTSLLLPAPAAAQTSDTARLLVTVVDATNASIPNAVVKVVGLEDATKRITTPPATANDRGLATFDGLRPGRYSVQGTFPGFEMGLLQNLNIRRGENRQVMVLPIKALAENVTVGGGQDAASSRQSVSFGRTFSTDELQTLSDDPAELQRQLLEMVGPEAVIRVDSFEGAQLPPKSQIKSVHVTRDQFAAEAPYPGNTFVDIITAAGVGPLTGGFNTTYRGNQLAGKSPFLTTRQPDVNQNFGANVSGSFIKDKADFSIGIQGQRLYTTPILKRGGSTAELLGVKQRNNREQANVIVNYALTKDQTLRLGFAQAREFQKNQGIGAYDGPERAYSGEFTGWQVRALEAGPIGRRTFINTRLTFTSIDQSRKSVVEAPTIVIQESRTTGGAQQAGGTRSRTFFLASDIDYIRGRHSWRTGFQVDGGWFDSDVTLGYLGTYTFADEASFAAGKPLQYTQMIGDPLVKYFNAQTAVYLQDDIRLSKALTLSPGVRYLVQTHVDDWSGVAPRFGLTWSPFTDGRTAIRLSSGLFYWPMETARVYEQTLRYDGRHQQQVLIVNPTYPNPGPVVGLPQNKYTLGEFSLQRNIRYSAGIEQRISPRLRFNALYSYWHQFEFWGGENLNQPVNGVRPDPAFANIFVASTTGELHRHDFNMSLNASLLAPSPAANQEFFNWKRLSVSANFARIRALQTGDGPFTPSPTGTLDTEWATGPMDQRYRATASLISTQVRNLNVNLSWNGVAGSAYTITTGVDNNLDGVLNDRPAGVGLRTLYMSNQSTLSLRAAYTLTRTAPGMVNGQPRRLRVGLSINAANLTNRKNYIGFSGNMHSPDFSIPTAVANPRRVDVGLNIGF